MSAQLAQLHNESLFFHKAGRGRAPFQAEASSIFNDSDLF